MAFQADFDIGRVVFVDEEKYTLDLISINGNRYKNIPFLNLYSKPKANGQGIYMMPERDSFAIILRLKHEIMGSADRFAIGFYNPLDENGSYSSDREEINQGDFVFKTSADNKIIGRTDGSITIMASDQSQITLFPASGNKKDSAGYDNLLRALFENLEINTDGGHIHHSVNKKEMTTNLNFEIRNKPLYSENPTVIRGNVGSQPPMEDIEDFITFSVLDVTENNETLRQEFTWRSDGYKNHIYYDTNEQAEAEFTVTENFSKSITHFQDNQPIFEKEVDQYGGEKIIKYGDGPNQKTVEIHNRKDGTFSKTIYSDGIEQYHIELDSLNSVSEVIRDGSGAIVYQKEKDSDGRVNLELGSAGQIQLSLDGNTGRVELTTDNDLNIDTRGNNVNVTAAGGTVKVDSSDIQLGSNTTLNGLIKDTAISIYNGHEHNYVSPNGPAITTGNTSPMSDADATDHLIGS